MNPAAIVQTERTVVRRITLDDAPFFHDLLNSEPWLKYIGNRDIPDTSAAENYIHERLFTTYEQHGFGYYLVVLGDGTRIGTCGFLKKPHLQNPDFGFAYLPEFHGRGYAIEAGRAIFDFGIREFDFTTIDAETSLDNEPSIHLLKKLDFKEAEMPDNPNATEPTRLFRWTATS